MAGQNWEGGIVATCVRICFQLIFTEAGNWTGLVMSFTAAASSWIWLLVRSSRVESDGSLIGSAASSQSWCLRCSAAAELNSSRVSAVQ
eukprot:7621445-Pyramimonas_sp.AAC.1